MIMGREEAGYGAQLNSVSRRHGEVVTRLLEEQKVGGSIPPPPCFDIRDFRELGCLGSPGSASCDGGAKMTG